MKKILIEEEQEEQLWYDINDVYNTTEYGYESLYLLTILTTLYTKLQ